MSVAGGGDATAFVGGGMVVSAGRGAAASRATAAFAGGTTAVCASTLLGGGTDASEGTAIFGGGTDVSVGRGTAVFVDGRATAGAEMADTPLCPDNDGDDATAAAAAAAPLRESADRTGPVATAGTESDGGGTSYFFLAAYCAYWCLK